jgi:GAF domain-containing protein
LGNVVQTGQLEHFFDLPASDYADRHIFAAQDIYETVVAPLIAGGMTSGAISFGRRKTSPFEHQDEILVQQIASLLASAIESQRLLAQAQARAERESRVRAAVDRVRQATDQEDILRVAREELSRMLGASQAVVQLKE